MVNLQGLAPTAKVFSTTPAGNQLLATFIATFIKKIDFKDLHQKFTYFFGGKSKILSVYHSGSETFPKLGTLPTCFYSAHLVQNYTRTDDLNGRLKNDQAKLTAALALTGLSRATRLTFAASEILLRSPEPIPPTDIINLTRVINQMRFSDFLSTE